MDEWEISNVEGCCFYRSIDLTDRVFIHNNGDNRGELEQCKIKNLNCFLTQQTTYIELSIHIYESEQPRIRALKQPSLILTCVTELLINIFTHRSSSLLTKITISQKQEKEDWWTKLSSPPEPQTVSVESLAPSHFQVPRIKSGALF